MKIVQFLISLAITSTLIYFLNTKQNQIPPLGKFLDPFGGFWQNGEQNAIKEQGTLKLDGVKEDVEIQFDKMLVPHIFANNDTDLFFAQGYVTAYHRLWQMEFQQLATEGRLSEILGKSALEYDRTSRRKGMAYAAEIAEKELIKDKDVYELVQAYADGVNSYINQLTYKDYPIEYKLLDYKPEPWTVYKTCLLLKQMSNDLSSGEMDLENTNLRAALGKETFDLLFPDRHPGLDPVIPVKTPFNFTPIAPIKSDPAYPILKVRKTIENPDPKNGSNNFVVAGSKTMSGNPILANEPDLGLNLPSIWYVAQLKSPSYNVFGATLPGAPFVIIGFNDSISWGVTNAKRDVVDWYAINFRDAKRLEYQYDDKWLKAEMRIEAIKVRGEDTFYDTVVYTHYGPVAYDKNFLGDNDKTNFAMRWTAHDVSNEQRTFYLLNKAENYTEYVKAWSYYVGPPQNVAFASASGDIALWINGKFPIKWKEQGKFLLDGSKSSHEWSGFIPHEHALHIFNPATGFVSSANQHPGDSTYPYYGYDYNYEYYRNRRINDRLKLMQDVTAEEMKMLQNDNYNYKASELLPMMLDSLDSANLTGKSLEYYTVLKNWDYFSEADRTAPTIFETWWSLLRNDIWDEFEDLPYAAYEPSNYNTYYLLKNRPELSYFDNKKTKQIETPTILIRDTFKKTIDSLENWKSKTGKELVWYEYKNTTVQHLLRIPAFSKSGVKIGGYSGIVNAASRQHGPSWRMVVEMTPNGPNGFGVYPGSQSGNPGNPTYGSMIDSWASGKYYPLLFLKQPDKTDNIITTLTLKSK
jgi:penicillin amidase